MKTQQESSGVKVLAENRKARFEYHILDTYEAGLVLTGAEIKAVRLGQATLTGSYVRPDANAVWIIGMHIKEYSHSHLRDYDPVRPRKLLLNHSEINKLRGRVEQKGLTIVPLRLYLKGGYAKLEIALAKGKNAPDKRQVLKERQSKRELERAIKGGR